jgi:hypothetical protein
MRIRQESQLSPVADEVSAITAVVRPILQGTLYALRHEVVDHLGGYEKVPLFMLADLRNPGDGDCGISFEYAVHDALSRSDPKVVERVSDALTQCKLQGADVGSILFGAEKSGSQMLIETANELLTDESRFMSGYRGKPVLLKRHISSVAGAFRSRDLRATLPQSISGLWKADLFLGDTQADKWVGTTVKINPRQLEGARGLRIGIVPSSQGRSDAIKFDAPKNLIVCPIPYDQSFMEVFYRAWEVVSAFLAAHARMPKEVALPSPAQREVARYLVARRDFPTIDVIDALEALSQPKLLRSTDEAAEVRKFGSRNSSDTTNFIAPTPQLT